MCCCIIFAGGDFYGLQSVPAPNDLVIAADAGFIACRQLHITPDLLIGDFDSLGHIPEDFPTSHIERSPVEKDDTDTMLAIKTGLLRGFQEFHIYGGTGGTRLDHTFANFQTLFYLCRHHAKGYLHDKNFIWTVIENEIVHIKRTVQDGLFSIFSLTEQSEGITLSGLQYPLENGILRADFPLGVSNHMKEEEITVSVRNGVLLLGWQV